MEKFKQFFLLTVEINKYKYNLTAKKNKRDDLFRMVNSSLFCIGLLVLAFLSSYLTSYMAMAFVFSALCFSIEISRSFVNYKKILILDCRIGTLSKCEKAILKQKTILKEIKEDKELLAYIHQHSNELDEDEYQLFSEIVEDLLKKQSLDEKMELLFKEEGIENY